MWLNESPAHFVIFLGEDLILLVETSGESDGTNFDEVTLLDAKGEEIQTFNLSATNNETYGSVFVPPVAFFQLQITGEDRKGNSIVRISSTGVQVSDVDLRLGKSQHAYKHVCLMHTQLLLYMDRFFFESPYFDVFFHWPVL